MGNKGSFPPLKDNSHIRARGRAKFAELQEERSKIADFKRTIEDQIKLRAYQIE